MLWGNIDEYMLTKTLTVCRILFSSMLFLDFCIFELQYCLSVVLGQCLFYYQNKKKLMNYHLPFFCMVTSWYSEKQRHRMNLFSKDSIQCSLVPFECLFIHIDIRDQNSLLLSEKNIWKITWSFMTIGDYMELVFEI